MGLPISAIVVGYNEGYLLRNALPQLQFCDEIIYVDLGSQDNSEKIAASFGARVIQHEKVSHVEIVHTKIVPLTNFDWILITDPDEVLSSVLINDIGNLFKSKKLTSTIGSITVPIIYYFKNRSLTGTYWGGVGWRILLIHKDRFLFSPLVHAGRKVLDGFSQLDIPFKGRNYVQHYWMNGYRNLFKKHLRYLSEEGEARFKHGRLVSLSGLIKAPYLSFIYSYFTKLGYKDGIVGLFLSLFWAWYETSAQFRTYRYQIKNNRISN